MSYKSFLFVFLIVLTSCKIDTTNNINFNYDKNKYVNKGFTLIYSDKLINDKIIKKKLDERSLNIYHDYLNKGTKVKITNLLNNKSLVANVEKKIKKINFYNSIISKRISEELEIDISQPYVEVLEIKNNSVFVAKKTKMFEVEKKVANKAPVDNISINDLNSNDLKKKKVSKNNIFTFYIKIADFYFIENAINLKTRIAKETNIKNINILKIAKNSHRLYIGPIKDFKTLQKIFFDISNLGFENIEIIKNDKI